MIYKTKN